jgi:hypothetical protein
MVAYTGLNLNELKEKLAGNFSMAMASAFPMYKWFPEHGGHRVDCIYYEQPADLVAYREDFLARRPGALDKSIGHLLFSHLPGWADVPERETCAMVYSSRETAHEFSKKSYEEGDYPGRMYRAVPALNSRVVIAPARHLRFSFSYALGAFGIAESAYLGSLGTLNSCFRHLLGVCGVADEFFLDWPLFLGNLQDIAERRLRPAPAGTLPASTSRLLEVLVKNKAGLIDFLDDAFLPLNNGFKVIDYNEGLKKEDLTDNEIWMAPACVLIEEEGFEGLGG